jgi:flagellar basal-body rod protein FlgB
MSILDSVSTELIGKDLDGLWARQQAISDNLANFETPGYQTKSVSFENALKACLPDPAGPDAARGTDGQRMEAVRSVEPQTTQTKEQKERADGNSVDLEQQEIEMARTALNYSYSLQAMSDTFSRLRTAITGK